VSTTLAEKNAYAKEPLNIIKGIPVFSAASSYTSNYERISQDHLSEMKKTGTNPFIPESLWKEMEEATSDFISRYTKTGDKILDVGVGLGRLLDRFPQLERYGMDIAFDYLEKASARGINCCYALIEDMPYRENFFDVIICTDVLEHVFDLNASLNLILRVLKPGGTLIVRVPYREDLGKYLSPENPYEFVHLRNFDEHTLNLMFTKILNCEILEWSTTGTHHVLPQLKSGLPSGRALRSATYRYYRLLEKFFPKKFDELFYKTEINFAVRKK
jgi:2-polyprenyl-3-methyl-5-hydroxy-6-metoxy-1,4-benzoquinol methylase